MRSSVMLATLTLSLSMAAAEVGPEVPVTDTATSTPQRNPDISREDFRTLIVFEEDGRIVLHQYEAVLSAPAGRATFHVASSPRPQRRPQVSGQMVAWVEEDAGSEWLWWQMMNGFTAGANFQPIGAPERIEDVKPGTPIAIARMGLFHVPVWTSSDGALKAVDRSLLARIGHNRSTYYVTPTFEQAVNPAVAERWSMVAPAVAYNTPNGGVRVTTIYGMTPQPSIELAADGATAPRVVFDGTQFVVFWSLGNGGTYAQRLQTFSDGRIEKIGEAVRIADGILQDAATGPNAEYYVIVDEGWRYLLLRIASSLSIVETTPFRAPVALGERVVISGDAATLPMLAYIAETPFAPRAVLRTIDNRQVPSKRRSAR